jgi:hypothetical protein
VERCSVLWSSLRVLLTLLTCYQTRNRRTRQSDRAKSIWVQSVRMWQVATKNWMKERCEVKGKFHNYRSHHTWPSPSYSSEYSSVLTNSLCMRGCRLRRKVFWFSKYLPKLVPTSTLFPFERCVLIPFSAPNVDSVLAGQSRQVSFIAVVARDGSS